MTTAPPTGFPLPLRNALAALAIAGLDDEIARAALAWLAEDATSAAPERARAMVAARHLTEPDGTLLAIHRTHHDRVRDHAGRARRAAAAFRPPAAAAGAVALAIEQAIALWNERLFFEVHEVLEARWKHSAGTEKQALQGLIQIAVALHHHAHGNARGAAKLMHEGRDRLAATAKALPTLDTTSLLAATARWDTVSPTPIARETPPPPLTRSGS